MESMTGLHQMLNVMHAFQGRLQGLQHLAGSGFFNWKEKSSPQPVCR
jgi:hypothetical protein